MSAGETQRQGSVGRDRDKKVEGRESVVEQVTIIKICHDPKQTKSLLKRRTRTISALYLTRRLWSVAISEGDISMAMSFLLTAMYSSSWSCSWKSDTSQRSLRNIC